MLLWLLLMVVAAQDETRFVLPEPGFNPYCRDARVRVQAMETFYGDCDAHRRDSMTRRPCGPPRPDCVAYRCRLGAGRFLYEAWEENPFIAQCRVYEAILNE